MRRKLSALAAALVLAAALAGCKTLRYISYVFAPTLPAEKVPAEFAELPGSSVAVVVYANDETLYRHPGIQLHVSSVVSGELENCVENVKAVAPRRIANYYRENIFWHEMDKTKLGQTFGAGYVLFINLEEFATLAPGSIQLYHGRLTATASLYQTSLPERDCLVWGPKEYRAEYPAGASTGAPAQSDANIRDRTIRVFAARLVKSFYKHGKPQE